MLKNHHYSKWALAKSVYVAPFIVLLLMLNCKHDPKVIEYEIALENVVSGSELEEEVTYEVDVTFGENESQKVTIKKAEEPLRNAEVEPEYPGGTDAMYKFLSSNITYPAQARADGISGQVMLEFVVERDGSVSNVKVLKSAHPDLDAEAVRVLKMMPNWKPGKQNGAPVRCYYNIPVRFTIN